MIGKGVTLCVFLLVLFANSQKIMYFHHGQTEFPVINLDGIRNAPVFVTYDCSKQDCTRYVRTTYPALYYWKGPGSAFERIEVHTEQAVRMHMAAKQVGVLNKFRQWLQELTLLQTYGCAVLFAGFLYSVFTLLFSPPNPKKPHHHSKHHKKE